jgi:hypothetical protein
MNVGRILAGGLFAGLVMNIGEYVLNEIVLKEKWEAAMADMGMEPMTGATIGVLVVVTFVIGIALVWLYAAMRPRFGAGPKTAIIAGFFTWLLLSGMPFVWNQLVPVYPSDLMMVGLVWSFFELPIAAFAGAWAYKEKTPIM